jgi:hypothetical protein
MSCTNLIRESSYSHTHHNFIGTGVLTLQTSTVSNHKTVTLCEVFIADIQLVLRTSCCVVEWFLLHQAS